MKKIKALGFIFSLLSLPVFAMQFYDSNGVSLGVSNRFKCSTGMSCSKGGDGSLVVVASPSVTGPLTITGAETVTTTLAVGGDASLSGNVIGDGGDSIYGYLNKLVAATATTITAAQCGSTFYNTGAVAINLPEASTALGCKLTFVTMNASNFDINPDDADTITVLTNANGDSIRNATLGNSVVLQAMSASQWVVVGKEQGTWSDIN
jgi:hypothetical protein